MSPGSSRSAERASRRRRDADDHGRKRTTNMSWFRNLQMTTKLLVGFAVAAVISKLVAVAATLYTGSWWASALVHLLGAGLVVGASVMMARFISRPLRQAVPVLEAVAAGDFTRRFKYESNDEMGRMAIALNRAVDGVRAALEEVRTAADQAAIAARELSAAGEHLSSGAQEQAASLEETAASLEEMTGTLRQSADNARQADQLASGARDVADHGGEVVATAVEAMGEINRASKKISDIITTIDEIAFQTNLLALNAAVEAARAGDQGRGFAVVAAEVRNLAQRSATAAKEIKTLIRDSTGKVEHGSALVNQSGQTLQEIVRSVKKVTDIIAEIAAAAAEQSSGIDQVNRAVTQMDQSVQSNATQTAELTATAHNLAAHAQQLQTLVGRFRLTDRAPHTSGARTAPPADPGAPSVTPEAGFASQRATSPRPGTRATDRPWTDRGISPAPERAVGAGRAPERAGEAREPASSKPAFRGNGRGATNGHADDGFQEF
jgi:methyl-accepting chemotaxis protein